MFNDEFNEEAAMGSGKPRSSVENSGRELWCIKAFPRALSAVI
jgi:hypothetical protein